MTTRRLSSQPALALLSTLRDLDSAESGESGSDDDNDFLPEDFSQSYSSSAVTDNTSDSDSELENNGLIDNLLRSAGRGRGAGPIDVAQGLRFCQLKMRPLSRF